MFNRRGSSKRKVPIKEDEYDKEFKKIKSDWQPTDEFTISDWVLEFVIYTVYGFITFYGLSFMLTTFLTTSTGIMTLMGMASN